VFAESWYIRRPVLVMLKKPVWEQVHEWAGRPVEVQELLTQVLARK
jgi:hypothetical protein